MYAQITAALQEADPFSIDAPPEPNSLSELIYGSPSAASAPTLVQSLPNPIERLSPRRLATLELVARGLTNREIAGVLGISPNTVKAHLQRVLETLELTNRTEAAMAFREFEFESAQQSS